MMIRLLLALALTCLSTAALASCAGTDVRDTLTEQEQNEVKQRTNAYDFPAGNVWTAKKGDRTFHIIGTLHMDDPRFDAIVPRLTPLVASADLLLVEATAEEEARLQRAVTERPELIFLTTGPTLPEMLEENQWAALSDAMKARGIPAFMTAKFQPWYLSVMLAMPGCVFRELQVSQNGLDRRIMEIAETNGVPQRALEPYDTLFRLIGSAPMETQLEYLALGALPDAIAEDMHQTLVNLYFEERPAEILEVNRVIALRHTDMPAAELDVVMDDMLASMLTERNLAWMEPILAAPNGVTVIAAGAAHLPGAQGILALLEAEGFQITRQPF